jgi:E3 ubiquitin-protein ligase ZNF598
MVEEHGTEMTSRDKKDARRVQADFEFDEVGIGGRRSRRDRGGGSGSGTERDPPPHNPLLAGPSGSNGRRRDGFGANLTVEGGTNTPPPLEPSHRPSPSPPPDDPILAEYVASYYRISKFSPSN